MGRKHRCHAGRCHPMCRGWGNQKPETRNQKPETRNQKPETRNQKPETRNQKPETRNQKPETRNQKPETRNQKPETRNQKPETRNQKPGTTLIIGPRASMVCIATRGTPYSALGTRPCSRRVNVPGRGGGRSWPARARTTRRSSNR